VPCDVRTAHRRKMLTRTHANRTERQFIGFSALGSQSERLHDSSRSGRGGLVSNESSANFKATQV
jgi:hypothetical protein